MIKESIFSFLKIRKMPIIIFTGIVVIFGILFYLYDIPFDAIIYGCELSFVWCAVCLFIDFYKYYKRHKLLHINREQFFDDAEQLPEHMDIIEYDYQELAKELYQAKQELISKNRIAKKELLGTMELFCEYRHVEADKEKTESVIRTIQQKISFRAYQMVYHAAMAADEEEKLDSIYRFLILGFHYGRKILDSLQNPIVMKIFELERKASNEAHIFRECIRFTEMNHHILVGIISPKCDVITLLAPHFVDRLPSEDWMIIDDSRRTAVVHPADQPYYLTSLSEEEMSEFLARESAAKDTDSMTAL